MGRYTGTSEDLIKEVFETNTTLEEFHCEGGINVVFYLGLNRARRVLKDAGQFGCPLRAFVDELCHTNKGCSSEAEKHQLQYAILMLDPSIWCDVRSHPGSKRGHKRNLSDMEEK